MLEKMINNIKQQYSDKQINRREFLRTATLLGLSAGAAWSFVSRVDNITFVGNANAQTISEKLKMGGSLRFAIRVQDYRIPHTYSWYESEIARQVLEHLTRTDEFGITHPYLLSKITPDPDLRGWTLSLRKNVKWHNGRDFIADDVIWNLKRILDPTLGSSAFSLMGTYMLNKDNQLWDAGAIQKINAHTIKLNLRLPALSVPEHLYHYPMHIMDPEQKGEFFPGANGTGPFRLDSITIGERAVIKARRSKYWGIQPSLDEVIFMDLGEDRKVVNQALIDNKIDGAYDILPNDVAMLKPSKNVQIYSTVSAATCIMGMRVTKQPFDNPKVRRAMKLSLDNGKISDIVTYKYGAPGENHHVAPVHPEYVQIPIVERNVRLAKQLLAEAGHPNGIDITLDMKYDQEWEIKYTQLVVEQFAEAGIRLKLNVMPTEKFWEIWQTTDFGLVSWGHRPLASMLLSLLYRTGAPWNATDYSNAELDKLLVIVDSTVDINKRRRVMDKIERILQDDGPFVQSFWRPVLTAFSKDVGNYKHHPSSYYYFNEMGFKQNTNS